MPSLGPISGAPISGLLSDAAPPDDPLAPNISDQAGCFDDPESIFLNVLEAMAQGSFPTGDAFIVNLLEAGGFASASGVLNVRARLEASDAALLTLDNASQILSVLKDRIIATSAFDCMGRFRSNATAGGVFQDSVAAAWSMLLADEGSAQDDAAALVRKLAALADTLHALGSVQGKLTAQAAVAVAAALEARVSAGWNATAVDQAALADEARNTLAALLAASDGALVTDAAAPGLRMVLLASDAATVADDPVAALRALEELADGAVLYCTIRLGGTDYQGWVLNTELRAVTEYRNVPFDSFAILNGRTYGAGDGGIFELAGNTDNGSPINAWFRPFLTDFGAAKMKRVSDIWIGTSAKGLLVKVHTKDPATGNVTEDIYPVEYSHGTGNDKCRVKVGRGLTSHWWTLTVANVAGADFAIDGIDWKPLILDRRQ